MASGLINVSYFRDCEDKIFMTLADDLKLAIRAGNVLP